MSEGGNPALPSAPVKKRKRGRPKGSGLRIQISMATIEALARVGCTAKEIAQELTELGTKVSARTIQRRIEADEECKAAYEKGFAHACVQLRKRMFLQAQMMNGAGVAQAQYLAHNWLGMHGDRGPMISNKVEVFNNQVVGQTSRDRIEARINRLAERIGSRVLELEAIEHKPQPLSGDVTTAPIVDVTPPMQEVINPVNAPVNAQGDRPSLGDIFRAIKEAVPA
jgi:hypothetical protein